MNLRIYLAKAKVLYNENLKTLKKKIKDDKNLFILLN